VDAALFRARVPQTGLRDWLHVAPGHDVVLLGLRAK
jgi:hypothetical protein